MERYYLPKHVSYCVRDDAVIFINIKTDEYSMIVGDLARKFLSLSVALSSPRFEQSMDEPAAEDLIRDLMASGVLTTNAIEGRPVAPTSVAEPTRHLLEEAPDTVVPLRAHHVWRFFCSCVVAKWRLRFQKIEHVIAKVSGRKSRRQPPDTFDIERARQLVQAFNRLRMTFPANYRCIFDSLALVEYLARYGIHPDWVFVVRRGHWAAHCWVQHGSTLFNESLEEAQDFIPIMTV